MTKPTRQQVVEALKKTGMEFYYNARGGNVVLIRAIADALVKAGLVEEPREEGRYQVKWHAQASWQEAIFEDGRWWTPLRPHDCSPHLHERQIGEPAIIGPRIEPPKE